MEPNNVPEENIFWLKNGRHIRNLHELVKELHHMDDATFRHHVTPEHNDFANWIAHAIKDEQLAKVIRACADKKLMENFVAGHLHELRHEKPLVAKGAQEVRQPEMPVKQPELRAKKPIAQAKPIKMAVVKRPAKPVVKPKHRISRQNETVFSALVREKNALLKKLKQAQEQKPAIIKKGPTTPLTLAHHPHIAKKGKTTSLHVAEKPQHHTSHVRISTHDTIETSALIRIGSYMVLGIVMGVAIAVISVVLL